MHFFRRAGKRAALALLQKHGDTPLVAQQDIDRALCIEVKGILGTIIAAQEADGEL